MLIKTLTLVATLAIAAGGATWYRLNSPKPDALVGTTVSPQPTNIEQPLKTANTTNRQASANTESPRDFVDALARELKAEFGPRIEEVSIQARLYRIRLDVMERFPASGLNDFNSAIRQAFPDHARAILALMDKLDRYNDWLDRETAALMDLAPLERHGTLWAKRRELFGDDADLIWADERNKLARKQEEMQTLLAELNQAEHSTLDETLYQLETRMKDTLGEDLAQYGDVNSVITKVFFGLTSVQKTLKALPPEQRQNEIDDIRRQMGYSEEQVERLHKRDQERNRRWNNGHAYMAERETLVSTLTGDERRRALNDLREQYFGVEAKTIRLEEENGFFRYERPRVYGRN
ncbi:hypothetical protein [Saccharospirillum salsuginis]|uniref:Lipase helper protein n=1 Tax=Saccharospirillum salsuginis TaxID=418750 RepID=A0A918K1U0_9GAMM|nr:hypothetical protein [Saccharospirillum salsuginis]GGX43815.1 hypothetical protein GCM10007392_08210 [Saccharospirillum salsuginis]